MTIANVALTNTFDEWRGITNQLVYVVSDLENINVRIIFDTSNAAYSQANTGRNLANTANITADLGYNQANTARTHANAAHLTANAGFVQANTARNLANTAATDAVNAYGQANTANITADLAFNKANTAGTDATNAFGKANTANITADFAYGNAANAIINAGLAFNKANTANTTADLGYNQANTARTHANSAQLTANAAFEQANTARNSSNNALANGMSNTFTTLTISSLALTGNIVLTGNVVASANLTGSTVFDSKGDIRIIPANEKAAVYALAKSDVGKFVTISTSSNVFVPNAIFTQGDAVTIYNNSSASLNIVSNSAVTMYLAGTANTITRRLAQRGVATVLCVFANNFVISGSGLT